VPIEEFKCGANESTVWLLQFLQDGEVVRSCNGQQPTRGAVTAAPSVKIPRIMEEDRQLGAADGHDQRLAHDLGPQWRERGDVGVRQIESLV